MEFTPKDTAGVVLSGGGGLGFVVVPGMLFRMKADEYSWK
jgi:hypothetical protein